MSEIVWVEPAEVRAWLVKRGVSVGSRGRLPEYYVEMFNRAHRRRRFAGYIDGERLTPAPPARTAT